MGKPLIMVSSITYAMKSKAILNKKGFHAYVERIPHTSQSIGCGYGVYVPERTEEAQQILTDSGIHITGRMERADSR